MEWWKIILLLIIIIALSIVGYLYVYKPYFTKGTSHVYYNGFWLNAYMYPSAWDGAGEYGNNDFEDSQGAALTSITPLQTHWQNYSAYSTLALCVGNFDPNTDMHSTGSYASDGTQSAVTLQTSPNNEGTVTLCTTLYDQKNASAFNIYLNKRGELSSDVFSSEYICCASINPVYYPKNIPIPSSTPPAYLAVGFIQKSDLSKSTTYFPSKWKYGTNFEEKGELATSTNDVSSINVLTCEVSLPSSMAKSSSLTSVTYYLTAGTIYRLNRQANEHNLGGPAMLNLTYTDGLTSTPTGWGNWAESRIYSSVPLFWNTDSPVSLYSTFTSIHGGGECSLGKRGVALNKFSQGCTCTSGSASVLSCSSTCPLTPKGASSSIKGTISFGPWCEWLSVAESSYYKPSSS